MDNTLSRIAKEFGTPVYVYYEDRLIKNYHRFYSAFRNRYPQVKILYAYKANTSLAICSLLRKEGAGADTVSGGEMLTAVKTGLRGKDILYTNNSKTPEEIATALDIGAFINADSPPDLRMIQKEAEKKNKTAKISFRINPDINPKTHPKIATGLRETKFGVHIDKDDAFNAYKAAKTMNHIKISGVHTHIGSQITETSPYIEAAEKIMEFTYRLKKNST